MIDELFSESRANYVLNILLHVTILFTFLTIFFFLYISKLEEKSINDEVNSLIKEQTASIISKIQTIENEIGPATINWTAVSNLADKIEKESQGKDPIIKKNNESLRKIGFGIIMSLIILIIGVYLYSIFYKKT